MLMDMGLEDEVRGLLDMGLTEDDISMKGIGYKELIGYFRGNYDEDEAVRLIKQNTRASREAPDDMVQTISRHKVV